MGRKDKVLKDYFSDSERFCDFINGAVFDGSQILSAKETALQNGAMRSGRKREPYLERTRDVMMETNRQGKYLICAVENQTEIHYGMVVRTMLMDALEYSGQMKKLQKQHREKKDLKTAAEYLSGLSEEDRLKPVLTVVFYYGTEPWDQNLQLHQMLEFPPGLERYRGCFPDYHLILIQPDGTDPKKFQTEWRLIFALLKSRRDPQRFSRTVEELGGEGISREGLMTAAVLLEDEKLLKLAEEEKEERFMGCQALDMIREQEWKAGEEAGQKVGQKIGQEIGEKKAEERFSCLIRRMKEDNRLEEFAELGTDPKKREEWLREYGI